MELIESGFKLERLPCAWGVVRESTQRRLVQVSCGLGLSGRSALTKLCALWHGEVPYLLWQQRSPKSWSSCARQRPEGILCSTSALCCQHLSAAVANLWYFWGKPKQTILLIWLFQLQHFLQICVLSSIMSSTWSSSAIAVFSLCLSQCCYLKGWYNLLLCWVAYKLPFSTWTPVLRKVCRNSAAESNQCSSVKLG